MRIHLIVNHPPWSEPAARLALDFAVAADAAGDTVATVFFREDGVYAATAADVAAAWAELAAATGARLQCCSAAVERRLAGPPGAPFEVAGLVAWCETLPEADRLVSF